MRVPQGVADRLLGDPPGEGDRLVGTSSRASTSTATSTPASAAPAVRSCSAAGSSSADRPGGWISTSSERRLRMRGAQALARVEQLASLGRVSRRCAPGPTRRRSCRPGPGRRRRGGRARSGGARRRRRRPPATSRRSTLLGGPVETAREDQQQGRGDGDQDQQRADGDGAERRDQLGLAVVDLVGVEVGLEQQRLALGGPDPRVDLDQAVAVDLVPVLGLGEVGDLGVTPAVVEHVALLLVEPEGLADQTSLVGPHHRPVTVPDLDPADVADHQAGQHLPVEAVDGSRVAVDQTAGDRAARRPSGPAPR